VRVLYFVENFWPAIGGVEVISARLLPLLAQRGHEVLVVTDRPGPWLPDEDVFAGTAVRRIPFLQAIHDRDIALLAEAKLAVARAVAEHRPDVLHAVFTGPGIWMLPPAEEPPLILSFHGSWPRLDFGTRDGLLARVLDRAAWVTACSENARNDLLAQAPHLADRSSVIFNGLDPAYDDEPTAPPAAPTLLCAGRVVYDKGFDLAVDALADLVGARPDIRLVIAGDGPELEAIRQRAAALGLAEHVELHGWVSPDEMHRLVERASVVLVPSRLEGFGLVALEAALAARPVVAARVGGLPEVVADGETGLLVAPSDAAALARAAGRLLADPSAAQRLGRAARSRAVQQFGAERHADAWDALYRRVGGVVETANR
jgi:glycogen(starch) synthase